MRFGWLIPKMSLLLSLFNIQYVQNKKKIGEGEGERGRERLLQKDRLTNTDGGRSDGKRQRHSRCWCAYRDVKREKTI